MKSILVLITFAFSGLAQATVPGTFYVHGSNPTPAYSSSATSTSSTRVSKPEDTSRQNREGKRFETLFSVGADYRMNAQQVTALYFLKPNQLIGLKGGVDMEGIQQQTNVGVLYKGYSGNSSYAAAEVFYLRTYENDSLYAKSQYTTQSSYTSLGAGVRVGNQWTWENFTIGADWIGMGHRFITFRKDNSSMRNMTWTFLNVSIGASF